MTDYYFSHFEINGEVFFQNNLSIVVTEDLYVTAVYEMAATPVFQVAGFSVYNSDIFDDFYIVNEAIQEIVIRFPTLDECIAWVQSQSTGIGVGLLIAGFLLYYFMRRK